MIRLDGARDLCASLAAASTLTHIDMSYNALDERAITVLGEALHENKVR